MFAFQYCGHIYYRAFQDIPATTELLVWYDDKYPQYMGIPLEIFETSPHKPVGKIWFRGELVTYFSDKDCSIAAFSIFIFIAHGSLEDHKDSVG